MDAKILHLQRPRIPELYSAEPWTITNPHKKTQPTPETHVPPIPTSIPRFETLMTAGFARECVYQQLKRMLCTEAWKPETNLCSIWCALINSNVN